MKTPQTPRIARIEGFLRLENSLLKIRSLSPAQKIVISYVASYEREGDTCTVTRSVMARHLGMPERTLDDVISSLFALNLVGAKVPKSGARNRRVLFLRTQDVEGQTAWKNLR